MTISGLPAVSLISGSTLAGLAEPGSYGPRRPLTIWMDAPGGVLKRSTRADCKSAGYAYVGSNPTPSTRLLGSAEVGPKTSIAAVCDLRAGALSEKKGRETQSEPCAWLGWQCAEAKAKDRLIHPDGLTSDDCQDFCTPEKSGKAVCLRAFCPTEQQQQSGP